MIVGLDLSLRAAAACWMPKGWKGDTRKLKVGTWGHDLKKESSDAERLDRMILIAESIVGWIVNVGEVKAVYVEDYAFSMRSSSISGLHESGGVVKVEIYRRLKLVPKPVPSSSCRKTLLQKLPRADVKKFTEQNVRRLKGEALYWNGDEVDAFCVANHGMMLEGGTPLSFLGT